MKLIFCPHCHDIFRIVSNKVRRCVCGKSAGIYITETNAEIYGHAIPLGFSNDSFIKALNNRKENKSVKFNAFVIEEKCPTVIHKYAGEFSD